VQKKIGDQMKIDFVGARGYSEIIRILGDGVYEVKYMNQKFIVIDD
jgi:hypothetical protein